MSSVTMEATTILPILKKKLAFLSGKTLGFKIKENEISTPVSSIVGSSQLALLFEL